MNQEPRRSPPPLPRDGESGADSSIESGVRIRVLQHQDRAHLSQVERYPPLLRRAGYRRLTTYRR